MIGARRPARSARSRRGDQSPRERLGAGPRPQIVLELARLDQPHRAEPALVAVDERRAVVELEHGPDVGGRRLRRVRRAMVEPPGHPQVRDERAPGVELEQQVLAAPPHPGEALAVELEPDRDRIERRRQPAVADVGADDRAPGDARREAAPDRLDLGQLGHPVSLAGRMRPPRFADPD